MAGRSHADDQVSGWTTGSILFTAVLMMTVGFFQAIEGIAAILEDQFYIPAPNYIYAIDVTAWGWTHLALGVVVGIAGWGVMSAQLWARIVGIIAAALSAIANFFFIPYYPIWALLIIAIDVFVIWTLCVYGKQEARQAGLRGD
ncbi:hypothetical protein ACFFMN_01705 [Planobispora siamensis]|uniref:DUF7144 domain-containing protein n=1 Tax=Planobispora siamensis TaxID=936338 RepID=A0A8J3SNB4_9ACTN|nr:hypothetical protein [Planobispora siamensis]GIH95736.1 hypothetical protein Psi01_63660 [Planobispora siamensis]